MKREYSLGARIIAFIIDSLCYGVIGSLLSSIGIISYDKIGGLSYIETSIVMGIYFVAFAYYNNGITIGKMVMNLEITTADFEVATRREIVFREITKVLTMPLIVISFLLAVFTKRHQTIHDMLTNTISVKQSQK